MGGGNRAELGSIESDPNGQLVGLQFRLSQAMLCSTRIGMGSQGYAVLSFNSRQFPATAK